MNGETLYAKWIKINEDDGVSIDSWDNLDPRDQYLWQKMAEELS